MAILNLPVYYPLRETDDERWGIKLRLPVSLGFQNFDDFPEDLQTFTFVPGIELEIPLFTHWEIKPYAQLGLGKDFSDGSLATIYGLGLKGLGTFPLDRFTLSLGGGMLLAGSRTKYTDDLAFSKFDLGLDVRHPVPLSIRGRPTDLGLFAVASYYRNDLDLSFPDDTDEEVTYLFEVGISIGTQPAFRIWRFDAPRVGLSYLFGDGLKGIRLNAGFPF